MAGCPIPPPGVRGFSGPTILVERNSKNTSNSGFFELLIFNVTSIENTFRE
jgi:hypothetical protein